MATMQLIESNLGILRSIKLPELRSSPELSHMWKPPRSNASDRKVKSKRQINKLLVQVELLLSCQRPVTLTHGSLHELKGLLLLKF